MVRDVAVLSVICIGPDERHRILGVSCALSESKVNWRAFFESLLKRGMSDLQFVVSDDHSGLKAAMKAMFGWAVWQRSQFDLAQNAIHLTPSQKACDFCWSRAIVKRPLISPNGSKTIC